jgi:hypothetical protein
MPFIDMTFVTIRFPGAIFNRFTQISQLTAQTMASITSFQLMIISIHTPICGIGVTDGTVSWIMW